MSKKPLRTIILAASAALWVGASVAQENKSVQAALKNAEGDAVGTVTLTGTPMGVLVAARLENLPAGEHGFHIHETGECTPDFSAAGDHFSPDGNEHGFANENGMHAGDMPNIFVAEDGTSTVHVFNERITLEDADNSLLDEDGSAVVVHAKPDSYGKEAGAGDRIACGVIAATQ